MLGEEDCAALAKNEPDCAGFMNELVGFVMLSAGAGVSSCSKGLSSSSFSISPKPPRLNGVALDEVFSALPLGFGLDASSAAFVDDGPEADWPNAGAATKGEGAAKADDAPKALAGLAEGLPEDADDAPKPKALPDCGV